MGIFRSYANPGAGINPHAPKKKPFARYWELLFRNLGRLFILNIVYSSLHIPLMLAYAFFVSTNNKFTNPMCIFLLIVQVLIAGPTLSGCARVLRNMVLDKACFPWEEFKKGFTRNFWASVIYYLIDLAVVAVLVSNWILCPQIVQQYGTKLLYAPLVVTLGIGIILLFMNFFLFPMQVATGLKKSSVIKNSLQLTCLSPKQCLLTVGCVGVMLAFCYLLLCISLKLLIIFFFFPAAWVGFTVMFINYPVIQKYVINPYYEETGEHNPEADDDNSDDEDKIFTDKGGTETPVKKERSRRRGRTIS